MENQSLKIKDWHDNNEEQKPSTSYTRS